MPFRKHTRVEAGDANDLRRYRQLVADLGALAADDAASADALRAAMSALLAPFATRATKSRAAMIREQLATEASALATLLAAVSTVGVDLAADHPLVGALATLQAATEGGRCELPTDAANPFGPTWTRLIGQPDRAAALGAFRAATLLLVKRSLRNGQASVTHSLAHRAPEDRLIPAERWRKERGRFIRGLAASAKPETAMRKIKAGLKAGLAALDAVVASGDLRVEDGRLIVPRPKAVEEDDAVKRGRTPEQLAAISGALALLTNIVMTWNATRMDKIVGASPNAYPRANIERMAPIAHAHIDMRGVLTFDLAQHRATLLAGEPAITPARAASR